MRRLRPIFRLKAGGFCLPLGRQTKIMGIVNITPDSFSQDGLVKGSRNFTQAAITQALRMIQQGADMIDIGGESTRPGSLRISSSAEQARIIPAIRYLAKKIRIPISADTYKADTAKKALDAGAAIINTIKGATPSKALLKAIHRYDAGIVLMHMRGTPRIMQKNIYYLDILNEIIDSLQKSIEICLETGIKSDKIIIDPGFGFGKTFEQNLLILNRLSNFARLRVPILIGTSRKSFIGGVLQKDTPQRLMGTAATITAGIMNGAHIVRVHDVRQIRDTVLVTDAIINSVRNAKDTA